MRTTIDLPAGIRQRLVAEAAARNLKGFSSLISEAVEKFFQTGAADRSAAIRNLKGCWNEKEYQQVKKQIAEGRKRWRT
jgi:hypothetical protein